MLLNEKLLNLRRMEEDIFKRALVPAEGRGAPDVVLPPEIMPFAPMEALSSDNWGYTYLKANAFEAWAKRLKRPVTVAIIDTARSFDHPDVKPYAVNEDGRDFTGENAPDPDTRGHGTMCAGCVVGTPVDGRIGTGPAAAGFCKVIPLAGLNSLGQGYMDWLNKAFEYAVNLYLDKYKKRGHAFVISNSWGSSGTGDARFEKMVDQAVKEGIIVTASAGNSGYSGSGSSVIWPGRLKNVWSVASIEANGAPSSFSSGGPEVWSTAPGGAIKTTHPSGGYVIVSGTSFSNPLTVGILSWFLAAFPDMELGEAWDFARSYITDLMSPGFDPRTGWGVPVATPYIDKIPGTTPDLDENTVDVELRGQTVLFANRQAEESPFDYDKYTWHSAKLSAKCEMTYEVGKYLDALNTKKMLFEALAQFASQKYFVASNDPGRLALPEKQVITLTSNEAGFNDIAAWLKSRLEIWLKSTVHQVVLEIDDQITIRI